MKLFKLFIADINIYYVIFFIDEVYNNPNLHSKEQDELEIPDGKNCFFLIFRMFQILLDFINKSLNKY